MKKTVAVIVICSLLFSVNNCSGSRKINVDNPPIGESVQIALVDGTVVNGVILQKEGQELRYVDVTSHKPERIEVQKVRGILKSDQIYDLEGNLITEEQVTGQKGMTKTVAYGVGGLVLGAAVGFGVGVILLANDIGRPIYPMSILGLGGAIYFGLRGADSDWEDAIDDIRSERYKVTQQKLKEELEREQQKLEEQKKELEELKKKKSEG